MTTYEEVVRKKKEAEELKAAKAAARQEARVRNSTAAVGGGRDEDRACRWQRGQEGWPLVADSLRVPSTAETDAPSG